MILNKVTSFSEHLIGSSIFVEWDMHAFRKVTCSLESPTMITSFAATADSILIWIIFKLAASANNVNLRPPRVNLESEPG